jgi:hypothetical protein
VTYSLSNREIYTSIVCSLEPQTTERLWIKGKVFKISAGERKSFPQRLERHREKRGITLREVKI